MSDASRTRPSAADRRRAPGIVAPVVGVALLAAAVVVARSPFFAIGTVAVSGHRILDAGEVRALAGVAVGTNIHSVSPSQVRARISRSPWVREAEVVRDLPGTLRIRIRERVPVGVASAGPTVVAVGADGVVVAAQPDAVARVGRLPDLGRVRHPASPGSRIRLARGVLAVAASLPDRLRRAVRSVSSRGTEISLALHRGGVVRYGRMEMLAQKNAAVLSMLGYARRRGLEIDYLDVRSPHAPALRPVAAAPDAHPSA